MLLLPLLVLLVPTLVHAGEEEPLRVFLRGGPKTHGAGEHDHPRFVTEFAPVLSARGCAVDGSLEFPGEAALEVTDVLVLYAAEGASIHGEERARLERYLARGGGLVVLHDAVCGDDPHWFKTVAGGAWEHGHSKYQEGEIGLVLADRGHPITQGLANFDFEDEIYWDLHLDPGAKVLANAFHTPFDTTPQMWTFEKEGYRAFVSLQGHEWRSFSHPAWRSVLLRGIAWAGKREADLLLTPTEVAELRYPLGGPRAPDRAHEALEVHPDFELSLVAAEPLVVNPISLDWDSAGRMWVALTPGYPDKQEFNGVPAHDSIVVLTDTDGDGRMDRSSTFAEGLDLVTSLVLHRDGVIVAQAPEVLFLRDTDGDGRSDRREVLYRGFGYGDTHATISNLRWGLDGWVYGTQGYSGGASRNILDAQGEDNGHIGNGLFRFRPDGSAIEMVVSYGSNTWGLDFADDGELVYTMANGSHLRHVILSDRELAAGRLERTESWLDVCDHTEVRPLRKSERPPYQQIDFVGAFTGAAGSCLYTGGAWPAEWAGDHFVCEPTVNLVHHDDLKTKGVTFTASKTREPEFLAARDLWFRPVHLRVGPDGALYVLDFYNQAAVHNDTRGPQHGPTNAAVRPDRDRMHGRIWRIQHRAARALPPGAGPEAKDPELLAALAHPNRWQRMDAARRLAEREELAPATVAQLSELVLQSDTPLVRLHALWILAQRVPEPLTSLLARAARDANPAVRKNVYDVARTLDIWQRTRAFPQPEVLLDETDPRAALRALVALVPVLPESAYGKLVTRLEAAGDPWTRSAVLACAARRPATFVEAALARPAHPAILAVLAELGRGIARRREIDRAVEVVTTLGERGAERPEACVALLTPLVRELPVDGEVWSSPRLDNALARLLSFPALEVGIAALPLSERWSRSQKVGAARAALGARLATVVGDPDQPLPTRLAGLETMLKLASERSQGLELAPIFLDPLFAPEVHARAIDTLGASGDVAAARVLCANLGQLAQAGRERAFGVLVTRAETTGALLDALESGEIKTTELGPQALHKLRTHPDAATAQRASELLGRFGGKERADKDALLAELLPLVDRPGDPLRGKELFAQQCGTCHTAAGVETRGGVGPDLTGMGAHGARELLPFLIDPNRAVEPGFLEYVIETTDGKLVDGVIKRETPEAVVLRSSTAEVEVPRDRIQSLRSTGRSPMPVGFESLGADALRDVITFLAGEFHGFRVLDLRPFASSSGPRGLYDTRHDPHPFLFERHGVVSVEGVPFELLDPARMGEQRNTLTLRGGMAEGWESHAYPQRIEVPVGHAFTRLHVLGGIAAWGYPYTGQRSDAVKLTFRYQDGSEEVHVLKDGTEFADWISRHDVPGSRWVDVLREDSWGQVRTFAVEVGRPEQPVATLVLESYDNHLAPTFVALTTELAGAHVPAPVEPEVRIQPMPQVLIFGGGSSHDFLRWFAVEDVEALGVLGKVVSYSEDELEIDRALETLEVLVLCNNQPIENLNVRQAIFEFVGRGGGLVLVHPATWYNWADWADYNRLLVGGGARSHEAYGAFAVQLAKKEHPILEGVPASFTLEDELYRLEPDASAGPSEVLATGKSLTSGAEYPVLWTRTRGQGRIVGLTLGHDGKAHEHPAYRRLLANAVRWAGQP